MTLYHPELACPPLEGFRIHSGFRIESGMTIKNVLNWAVNNLKKASSSPALDAEVLFCHVLKRDRGWLYANPEFKLSRVQHSKFKILISKRARYWPVAYLTGHKEFFGLDFLVTPAVLIPRPETETLVELAFLHISSLPARGGVRGDGRKGRINVIDLGTGSGNIIITIVKAMQNRPFSPGEGRSWKRGRIAAYKFYAVDTSAKALQIAKSNARRHRVLNKIKFLRGNLLDPLSPIFSPLIRGRLRGGRILIIANLPYLTASQYSSNPDLAREPRQALATGPDGLKYYKELFAQLHKFPSSPGEGRMPRRLAGQERSNLILLFEHDPTQQPALTKLARHYFPSAKIQSHKDLAGKWRVMEIQISLSFF